MKQSDRATATLEAMRKELKILKQDITFREYLGYEMCMKKFKEMYSWFLTKEKK